MRFPRRSLLTLAALALPLSSCAVAEGTRVALNVGAGDTASQNVAAGLPDAEVWCWAPPRSDGTNDWWIVSSAVLRHAGSCDETIRRVTAQRCDATACHALAVAPPATETAYVP